MRTLPKIGLKKTYIDRHTGYSCYIESVGDVIYLVSWKKAKDGSLKPYGQWIDWKYAMENLVEHSDPAKILFGKKA